MKSLASERQLLAQSCQSLECPFPGAAGLPVEHLDFSVWTHMRHQRRDVVSEVNPRSQASCLVFSDPTVEELPTLSALCLRSKAVWGYGSGFMEACRNELTIQAWELQSTSIAVAEENGKVVGVAQVKVNGGEADLLKLFVEPTMLRGGVGMQLFHWATSEATAMGAYRMLIEADPDAAPFYRRMGAKDCGFATSGSIPGRMLPKLVKELGSI
jgi:GNAT superfamily N-acetyltransferase